MVAQTIDDFSLDPFQTEEDALDIQRKLALAKILRQGVPSANEDISSRVQRNMGVLQGYDDLEAQTGKRKALSDRYEQSLLEALRKGNAREDVLAAAQSPALRKEALAQYGADMKLGRRKERMDQFLGGGGGPATLAPNVGMDDSTVPGYPWQEAQGGGLKGVTQARINALAASGDPEDLDLAKFYAGQTKPHGTEGTYRMDLEGNMSSIPGAVGAASEAEAAKYKARMPFGAPVKVWIDGKEELLPPDQADAYLRSRTPANSPAGAAAPTGPGPTPAPASGPSSPASVLSGAVGASGAAPAPVGTTTPPRGQMQGPNAALDGMRDLLNNAQEEARLLVEAQQKGDKAGVELHSQNGKELEIGIRALEKKTGMDANQVLAQMKQQGSQAVPGGALPQSQAAAGIGPIGTASAAPPQQQGAGPIPNQPQGPPPTAANMQQLPQPQQKQRDISEFIPQGVAIRPPQSGSGGQNPAEVERYRGQMATQQAVLGKFMEDGAKLSESRFFVNQFRDLNKGESYEGHYPGGMYRDWMTQNLGGTATDKLRNTTQMDGLSSEFTSGLIKQFGANPSDADARIIKANVPGIADDPKGRELKLARMEYVINRREAIAPEVHKMVAQGIPADVARSAAVNWYDQNHPDQAKVLGNPTQADSGRSLPLSAAAQTGRGATGSWDESGLESNPYMQGAAGRSQAWPAAKDTVGNLVEGTKELFGSGDRKAAMVEKARQDAEKQNTPGYSGARNITDIALNPFTYAAGAGSIPRAMMAMAGQSATQPAASKEEQVVQGGVGGLLGAGGALVSKLLPGAGASTQKGVSAEILNDIANANPKIRYPWRAAKALFGGMYEGADKAIAASPAAIKNMVELLRRGLVRAPADLYEENR